MYQICTIPKRILNEETIQSVFLSKLAHCPNLGTRPNMTKVRDFTELLLTNMNTEGKELLTFMAEYGNEALELANSYKFRALSRPT